MTVDGHNHTRQPFSGGDGFRHHLMPTFPTVPRPVIHVNVTEAAHQAYSGFAAQHGVTLAAFVEVLGLHINDAFPDATLAKLVTEARELAHARRRAGGPRKASQ